MNNTLTLVVAAALQLALPLGLVAAERATFILGYFNLRDMPGGTGNLRERACPEGDVAVIDFAGGTPRTQELNALTRMGGQRHMLVIRSGAVICGWFGNIIDGSTVIFTNRQGERQSYSARDVTRVYLDIDAALTIFDVR